MITATITGYVVGDAIVVTYNLTDSLDSVYLVTENQPFDLSAKNADIQSAIQDRVNQLAADRQQAAPSGQAIVSDLNALVNTAVSSQ